MTDYLTLESLVAKNPRLNDVLVLSDGDYISLRSKFGLWLKRGSPKIGKPEADTNLVEVPGSDLLLDLTKAIDGSVHFKKRTITMEFVCDRPKKQWAYIRSQLEVFLQGQWLQFYFTRDGEVWAGQFDVEMTPGEYNATVKMSATCNPWPQGHYFILNISALNTGKLA